MDLQCFILSYLTNFIDSLTQIIFVTYSCLMRLCCSLTLYVLSLATQVETYYEAHYTLEGLVSPTMEHHPLGSSSTWLPDLGNPIAMNSNSLVNAIQVCFDLGTFERLQLYTK